METDVSDTLDFILHQQLATLQFRDFEPVTRRVGQFFSDFVVEFPVLSFKIRKMRLHGHVEWLPGSFQLTPLTRTICHETPGKSIIRFCALR